MSVSLDSYVYVLNRYPLFACPLQPDKNCQTGQTELRRSAQLPGRNDGPPTKTWHHSGSRYPGRGNHVPHVHSSNTLEGKTSLPSDSPYDPQSREPQLSDLPLRNQKDLFSGVGGFSAHRNKVKAVKEERQLRALEQARTLQALVGSPAVSGSKFLNS